MKKNIIITGTSRGIGFCTAKLLAKMGHNLLCLSRNIISAEFLKLPNVISLQVDLSCDKDFEKITHFVKHNWNKVDVLINNAGILINKPFSELSPEDFVKTYQVNVFAVARLIQIVLPFMKKGANVLNISSMGGVQGSVKFAGLVAYSSSKGALITLTELLAEEYKEQDITFNVLALGAVQTQMLQEAFPSLQVQTKPEQIAAYITDFVLEKYKLFNGKILQVANSTP